MNLAWVSVGALAFAIVLSCVSQVNVGIVAIGLAWLIGVYLGGYPVKQVMAGFPAELFLTLAGVTLLFAQAQVNGTLAGIAAHAVRACRGSAGWTPIMFFWLSAALASMGPGNIATAALMAPAAMATAERMKISPFLMAIMVGNGANAGSLSPFAPTGIIVNGLMDRIGLHAALSNWATNLGAHAFVAFAGYALFGGLKLFRRHGEKSELAQEVKPFNRSQWITIAMIALLVLGAFLLKLPIGMAAFACAAVLSLIRAADDGAAIHRMPWSTLLMVSGVTVLIALLEKTQGLELFATMIARISTRESVTAVVAFVTGLVSAYSSTSGVVLPAFLPTIPSLLQKLGGGDPLAVAGAMNVGGHLVDVSPLSTIGALCIASVTDPVESKALFHKLLAWGLAMTVVGALLCYAMFGLR